MSVTLVVYASMGHKMHHSTVLQQIKPAAGRRRATARRGVLPSEVQPTSMGGLPIDVIGEGINWQCLEGRRMTRGLIYTMTVSYGAAKPGGTSLGLSWCVQTSKFDVV